MIETIIVSVVVGGASGIITTIWLLRAMIKGGRL